MLRPPPATPAAVFGGNARQVRFDIKDGGSVQHIDAPNPQCPATASTRSGSSRRKLAGVQSAAVRHPLLFICVVALVLAAAAASAQTGNPTAPGFLTRLQRVRDHEDVCVLVARDGNYRLERRFLNETHVYVGVLPYADLQGLETVLNNDRLRNISPQEIPRTLVHDSRDLVLVDIYRKEITQHLSFPGGDSRKPFRDAVDPVLERLADIEKADHTEISESSASHCLPAGSLVPQASPSSFLMILARTRVSNGLADASCVIIYRNGRYRKERKTQPFGLEARKMKLQVGSGQIEPSSISRLETLLDSEPLASLRHDAIQPHWSRESEITELLIPRPSGAQQLHFSNEFGIPGDPLEAGGASGMTAQLDPQERAIEPIRSWLKKNVEHTKLAETPTTEATNCADSP